MHVLWLTTVFDDSAVSNIILQLLPHFPAHHTFTIVSLGNTKQSKAEQDLLAMISSLSCTVHYHSLKCKRTNILEMTKKLNNIIQSITPNIIHAQLGRAYIVALLQKLLSFRNPSNTYNNSPPRKPQYLATFHNNSSYFHSFTKLFLRKFLKRFDAISAVSNSTLQTIYSSFLPQKNIPTTVIYNPLNINITNTQESPTTLPSQETTFTLLIAGRLIKEKGHELWIAMLPQLQKRLHKHNCSIQLWCAGVGPMHDTIINLCNQNKIQDKVHMLGYRKDVFQLMGQTDLVLFPSLDEGFGLVPCEAILMETPIVTHILPVMEEILHTDAWSIDCTNAEIFASRCEEILLNKDSYQKQVAITKQVIESQYHPSVIANNYISWYDSVLH